MINLGDYDADIDEDNPSIYTITINKIIKKKKK